jgi:uncharacterized membrane-anchored protein
MNEIMKSNWNKVPAVGLLFWVAKLISTAMGEAVSDASNGILNGFFGGNQYIGAVITMLWAGGLFLIFLQKQRHADRYRPIFYWGAVALLAIFGTVIADSSTAVAAMVGIPIVVLVVVALIVMGLCFYFWYRATKNLSIHQIRTKKSEAYYWVTVALRFMLGTLVGDWMGDNSIFDLKLGYLNSGLILSGIFLILVLYRAIIKPRENGFMEIVSFWIAYVLTRPIGASFSDYLSYKFEHGILGNREVSLIFIALFAVALGVTVIQFGREKRVAAQYLEEK